MKYLLDTHTWIWWHMNPSKLSKKVKQLILGTKESDELLLSSISSWEFCKLLEKNRLGISCNTEDWLISALDMPKLRLIGLTPKIAYRSTVLPRLFPSDPGNQIIVATAREEKATILTKDEKILEYKHVKSVW